MRRLAGCVLLLSLPGLAGAQSLAEAARKERERRKQQGHSSAPIVTEEELRTTKGTLANEPSTEPGATPAASPPAQKKRAAPPTPASQDTRLLEEQWRGRAAAARARVEAAQQDYDMLSALHLPQGGFFVDENNRVVVRSPEELQRLVARAKAELDAARQALEGLEESARRENVPPGWLR